MNTATIEKQQILTGISELRANRGVCFKGISPNGKGFVVDRKIAELWIKEDGRNEEVLKPYIQGKEVYNLQKPPDKYLIDFSGMPEKEARSYKAPFNWINISVRKNRQLKDCQKRLKDKWWEFEGKRLGLRKELKKIPTFYAIPERSKVFNITKIDSKITPGGKIFALASISPYLQGLLSSSIYLRWFKEFATKERYSGIVFKKEICFLSFPFPQKVNYEEFKEIEDWIIKIQSLREIEMKRRCLDLETLYLECFNSKRNLLGELHSKLDEAVMKAYGFEDDFLAVEKLKKLNMQIQKRTEEGKPVLGAFNYRGF